MIVLLRELDQRLLHPMSRWFALRCSLAFSVLVWLVFLLPFYHWALFGQRRQHKASVRLVTHVLFVNGWREMLLFAVIDLAVSVGVWLLIAYGWNFVVGRLKPKAAVEQPRLSSQEGVWPPPPTNPA